MLHFNVIYTPGTVRDFRLFALSLLKHTPDDCHFRLVTNGCSADEVALLRALCANHHRFELVEFPTQQMEAHATVVEWLRQRQTDDYFCIFDSDILAAGNFVADLMPLLDSYDAVFSGRNLWVMPEEAVLTPDVKRVSGRFTSTPSGLCIGGTYCAIYNARVLNNFIDHLNPSFPVWHKRTWNNIPRPYRQWMTTQGLKRDWFDTSKVLNALLQKEGHKLTFIDSPSLHHIGGFSIFRWQNLGNYNQWEFYNRRAVIGRYLSACFDNLYTNQPLPPPPNLNHPDMAAHLQLIVEHLQLLYDEFKDELAAAEKAIGYVHKPVIYEAPSSNRQWRKEAILWLYRRRIMVLPPGSARERIYLNLKRRVLD